MKAHVMKIASLASVVALAGVFILSSPAAYAAEGEQTIKHVDWSFKGPLGTYDRNALRRGYKVYKEVCAACHSMSLVSFRNLSEKGGPEFSVAQVKAIAAEFTVTNEDPDAAGDSFDRPGEAKDRFPSPFANPEAAAASNGGAVPPDLSVIAKARPHGPDYHYSLLTGYVPAPAGFEVGSLHYNAAFPGHLIAMPAPLSDGQVEYEDGTPNTVDQMAKDVTQFMMWTAEPKLEQRHYIGFMVMAYLLALAGILFFATRKVWADQH
jgi:cytochrome c1